MMTLTKTHTKTLPKTLPQREAWGRNISNLLANVVSLVLFSLVTSTGFATAATPGGAWPAVLTCCLCVTEFYIISWFWSGRGGGSVDVCVCVWGGGWHHLTCDDFVNKTINSSKWTSWYAYGYARILTHILFFTNPMWFGRLSNHRKVGSGVYLFLVTPPKGTPSSPHFYKHKAKRKFTVKCRTCR